MMNVVTAISGSHNIRQRTRRTAKSKAAAMALSNLPKFADMKEHAKATLRASSAPPTPPPGLSPPPTPPPVPVASKMRSGEKKFQGPWLGLNSAARRRQVQFAKCLVTVLRHGHFKDVSVTITSDGSVLLDEISRVMNRDPAEIVQVLVWSNNITTKTKITKTQ